MRAHRATAFFAALTLAMLPAHTDQCCNVKKVLANPEPSTHGPKRTSLVAPQMSAFGGKADMGCCNANVRLRPKADIAAMI